MLKPEYDQLMSSYQMKNIVRKVDYRANALYEDYEYDLSNNIHAIINPEFNDDTKLWHWLYYQYCSNCKTFQVQLYEYTNNDKMYPLGTDLENRLKYLGSHLSKEPIM